MDWQNLKNMGAISIFFQRRTPTHAMARPDYEPSKKCQPTTLFLRARAIVRGFRATEWGGKRTLRATESFNMYVFLP
jgi:hypothetical protein